MQGLKKLGGVQAVSTAAPTQTSERALQQYGLTVVALTVPAVCAAVLVAMMVSDGKPTVRPSVSLAERTEMLRYAEQKIETLRAPVITDTQPELIEPETTENGNIAAR